MSGLVRNVRSLFFGPPTPPRIEVPAATTPAPPPPFQQLPPAAEPRVEPSLSAAQQAAADERERSRQRPRRGSSGVAVNPLGVRGFGGMLVSPTLGR